MQYHPPLDGLRAIAALSVLSFHTNFSLTSGGWVGVDIFFVLSGFLITSLIREELKSSSQFSFKNFYIKRFSRLTPPLITALTGTYIIYSIFLPHIDINKDVAFGLMYISDYGHAFWHIPEKLKHTWSLSVEQHFYLITPVLLVFTKHLDDRQLFRALLTLFAIATLWRTFDVIAYQDWDRTYYRFDTRVSGLILGSALAVCPWKPSPAALRRISWSGFYGVVLFVALPSWNELPSLIVVPFFVEISTVAVIMAVTSPHQTPLRTFLSHPWMVYVGTLSYAIYLWHYGIAIALRDLLQPPVTFAITLTLSLLLAAFCHRFIDTPSQKAIRQKLTSPTNRTVFST